MQQPRRIDCEKTFASIVSWIKGKIESERAPGLIIGLSGTDSILTFMACYSAFEELGKPERVLGLNFEHSSKNTLDENGSENFKCVKTDTNWVKRDIFPFLKSRAPHAILETDDTIPHSDDNKRWGHLFSRAVKSATARQGMIAHFFPVGTRNATEQALGTYSQISKSVSMLPIVGLYKTEVLALCEYLAVPQIAIDKSREIDCDCGRFDVQANHMRELDLFIMHKQGLLSRDYLNANIPRDILNAIIEFYAEETSANSYRPRTPYLPQEDLAVFC